DVIALPDESEYGRGAGAQAGRQCPAAVSAFESGHRILESAMGRRSVDAVRHGSAVVAARGPLDARAHVGDIGVEYRGAALQRWIHEPAGRIFGGLAAQRDQSS